MITISEFREEWDSPEKFVTAHTSGSTGKPKNISLLKSDMRASADATNLFFSLSRDSHFVCPLSLNYIAAKMMCVRAWQLGARISLLPPSNAVSLQDDADLLAVVPSQVPSLLQDAAFADKARNVIIGGAPLSHTMRRRLAAAGVNAYETYGMTETCSHVALKHVAADTFEALPEVSFALDERGCLVVDVPYMSFQKIVTNDIVELVDPRHFIWKGRFDNVINTGAVKVFPEEVEAAIRREFNPAFDFYIIGMPHDTWGTAVVMVAEATERVAREFLDKLRKSTTLPRTHIPKDIFSLMPLPRTSTGKLRRLAP